MSRTQAMTLAAVTDLLLAVVFAAIGYATGQLAFALVGIALLVGAVAVLVISRRS